MTDYCVYLLVRSTFAIVQTLGTDRMLPLAGFLGYLLSDVLKVRRKVIDQNLRIASPEASQDQIDHIRRKLWEHLVIMGCEVAWSRRRLHRYNWQDGFYFPQAGAFLRPYLEGRPLVIVTGHYGNFELGGYATGLFGVPTMTVARPLDNRFLNDYIKVFRVNGRQEIVDKDGSSEIIQKHLESGGTLSLVADQFAGPRGCWVNFFGHPTSCHKALALFTLSYDAPMSVFYSIRTDKPMKFEVGCPGIADPRDGGDHLNGITELTKWFNGHLEQAIAKAPEQYWWMHRRWRDVPPKIMKRLAKQAA